LLPLALSAVAVLPYLSRPVLARHKELRVALTARHMVESGDWITPESLDHLRLRKPPLMYWAMAAGD
jgi:4-amino-4-deoxy-L-arabinose transferase-like glycosyltransferase